MTVLLTLMLGFSWRSLPNEAFNIGEKLSYEIRWTLITAGEATMEVLGPVEVSGRKAYHLFSSAKSAPRLDAFFKVRTTNESWMDMKSLCSLAFEKHAREGKYSKDQRIHYDQTQHLAYEVGIGTFPMAEYVQDVLSSLYYIRAQKLPEKGSVRLDVNTGKNNWAMEVIIHKKEKIKVPAGVFQTILVEPTKFGDGPFKHSGRLFVWLTDDARKIPVKMRSKVAVGDISALLTKMETK